MNGKDIIWSLKNVSDSIVEEAEYGEFPIGAEKSIRKEKTIRMFRRPFLVAALIALTVLLVGCAVAYVNGWFTEGIYRDFQQGKWFWKIRCYNRTEEP